ncbi:SIS domain-containing protein [Brevibacterium casei]|uniref:Putative SIS (Sugar ISomerase) domain protein n=1 Tax=Brevibacterium casei S18 TaxID=1229781 RepID=K9AQG8_9MICO|nr:SIS (sugar ISomerase) domain protein [Brevibacterium casei]SIG88625.1 glucosamine--fructose-6-phosphate aminotransferase, isomerizing [Mycobacteroides abscessus subsp. abscessus]EKU48261.1 putative SIS (sugar ISomerase) domain protein [Brevibacterium casei S18]MCT1447991.1 sugar isomerase [Brevibacterium casei]MCT1766350.1 sugar isomerase [Brevibacterium casei]MCT2182697.1 sugar isomerase [Brevibacterium casei]
MSIAGEFMAEELRSQPETWERTLSLSVPETAVPADGERVAVIGCGSSWFASQIYANLRETAGQGETDAFTASEYPFDRSYDRVVAISRSGTTTEVVDALERLRGSVPVTAIVGGADSPIGERSNDVIALDFADERSVVQTRFCTSTIALLRSWAGGAEALGTAVSDAQAVLEGISEDFTEFDPAILDDALIDAEQYSFLGMGWTWGLANEAALKLRESAQTWTESYSSMEYRHGPIAIAAPGRVTWQYGEAPDGLKDQVEATGARFVSSDRDPLAELVRLHALALTKARRLGVDPDHPRSLTRSVILDS